MGSAISIPTDPFGWFCVGLNVTMVILLLLLPSFNADLSIGKLSDDGMRRIHTRKCLSWTHAQYPYKRQFFLKYALSLCTFAIVSFATLQLIEAENKWFDEFSLYFWCSVLTFSLHQIKRCFEVLFVHSYSHETMHFGSALFMIFHYFIMALTMGYGHVTNKLSAQQLSDDMPVYVGLCMWIIGEIGNGICHFWIAHARKQTFAGYIALSDLPFIFRMTIAPNLVFELLIWTGYAVIVRELNSVIVVVQMWVYVVPRIYKLRDWYYSHPEGTMEQIDQTVMEDQETNFGDVGLNKMDSLDVGHIHARNKDLVSMHTSFQSTQIVM